MTPARRALFAATMFLAACAPASSDDTDTGDDSTGEASTTGAVTTGPIATTAVDTTGPGPIATSTTSGSSSDEAGFIPRPDMGGPVDGLPNGEQCSRSDECASGSCFNFPGTTVGFCSDCESDADCMENGGPGTCTFGENFWAMCGTGAQGEMCMSQEACMDPWVCASAVPGSSLMTCGECLDASGCDPMQLCLPVQGSTQCIDPGTVENGEFCSAPDDGACISGHCTPVSFMNMEIGLFTCGECSVDEDCDPGLVCMPAEIDNMGQTFPSMCG